MTGLRLSWRNDDQKHNDKFLRSAPTPPSAVNSTVSDTDATTTGAGDVSSSSSEASSSEEESEAEGPSVTADEKEGPPPMLSALDAFEEVARAA